MSPSAVEPNFKDSFASQAVPFSGRRITSSDVHNMLTQHNVRHGSIAFAVEAIIDHSLGASAAFFVRLKDADE